MGSTIGFKHKFGDAMIGINTIKQISTFEYGAQHDIFIDNIIYSFDDTNEMNEVYERIRNLIKENK